jgi:hypothetical protein
MDWFDCNASFGRSLQPGLTTLPDAQSLLGQMDFCGVSEALVYHIGIERDSAQAVNRAIVEEVTGEPRLHPTWAILPPQTGELGTVEGLLGAMRERGVKALRSYPDEHRYLLNGLTFGPLLEEMVARNIPLILGPNWQRATDLLAECPALRVIVTGSGSWGDDRYFRPLMERYPGFHLDISNYQLAEGLPSLVQQYGSDQILYGSGTPRIQMGGSLLTVAQAELDDSQKQAIAGANLRRILSEVRL